MNRLMEEDRVLYAERCKNKLKEEIENLPYFATPDLHKYKCFKIFDIVSFEDLNPLGKLSAEMRECVKIGQNKLNNECTIPNVMWDNIQYDQVTSFFCHLC